MFSFSTVAPGNGPGAPSPRAALLVGAGWTPVHCAVGGAPRRPAGHAPATPPPQTPLHPVSGSHDSHMTSLTHCAGSMVIRTRGGGVSRTLWQDSTTTLSISASLKSVSVSLTVVVRDECSLSLRMSLSLLSLLDTPSAIYWLLSHTLNWAG